MTVRIDLKQTKSVVEGPEGSIYKTLNEIIYAQGIPAEVFVFARETQEFSNVASVWQVQNLPVGYDAATEAGSNYYRKSTAEVGYPSVETAVAFAAHVRSRVDGLLNEFVTSGEQFVGTNTYSYTAG